MDVKMGRHYLADLYLCQKNLWEDIPQLKVEITNKLGVDNLSWVIRDTERPLIMINNQLEAALILIQMFPEYKYLALDFFSWNPDLDLAHYCENLIEIFAPQVVAAETRFRAEHLN